MIEAEDPPQFMIDGARVLRFAFLDASRGPYSTVVNGMPVDGSIVTRLVIAEDLVEDGVYLLHCNRDWDTVAASHFGDAGDAQRSADSAYESATPRWVEYRDLTDEEKRQVETTRAFLKELASGG
ncbi:MAG TPA: hypothetical protein VKR38_07635 [Usitatibacter sp.]|nr:hypothetical protein [Usitatibacter sp.]